MHLSSSCPSAEAEHLLRGGPETVGLICAKADLAVHGWQGPELKWPAQAAALLGAESFPRPVQGQAGTAACGQTGLTSSFQCSLRCH